VSETLDMLPAQIKPEQRRKLNVRPDTQPAAYEAYIRGRGYLQEYEKPENIDSAIAEFNQALKIDPNYAPAYAGLGEGYWIGYQQLNRGKDWLANASANCEKALVLSTQLAEGYTCLGNASVGTGKYEKAVEQFQRALELNPDSDYALVQLAGAYQKLGNPQAAEAAYRKAISLRPNYWGVYSGLGAFYAGQARYSEAAEMFSKVIQLASDNYGGYSNLGGVYLLQGRYEDAISQLKRSIDLRPNPIAYSNLGTAYFALRRFPEAAETFQQGAKLDDRNWINWGNLGDALYWIPGRRLEAAKPYHTAISLARGKLEANPRDGDTWAMVAAYYAMLDDKAHALESIQRALESAPGDPDVAFRAAIVYNHFGDTGRSLAWLKKAVDAGFSRSSIRDLPDFDSLQGNAAFRALMAGG
jgi:tetratricopeptide (TPR) repeat protein